MAVGNSGSTVIGNTSFYGGLSSDRKIGISGSAYENIDFFDAECLDFRKTPSQMTLLPQARSIVDNVEDMLVAMTQISNGEIYGVGDTGDLYKVENDTVSRISWGLDENGDEIDPNTPSAYGLEYMEKVDNLFFTLKNGALYRYGRILSKYDTNPQIEEIGFTTSTAPRVVQTLTEDYTGAWVGSGTLRNTGTASYNVLTSLSEADVDKCRFMPDIEPLRSIKVNLKTVVAGSTLTLELHDAGDNVLSRTTKTMASTTGYIEFLIDTALAGQEEGGARVDVSTTSKTGSMYHWHLYSSVAGNVVNTVSANDLDDGDFELTAFALVRSRNGRHPMVKFGTYLLIGNGDYVAQYEPSGLYPPTNEEFQRHRLQIPAGYEVCSMAINDEYVVIGCEKRSTDASNAFQDGIILFWDGFSQNYNFLVDCKMGSPLTMATFQNITYIYIQGALYAYNGGKELIKVRTLRDSQTEYEGRDDITITTPNMMTIRRDILLFGYPSTTTSHKIRHGILSWGAVDKNYPQSLGYSYKVPTGRQFNTEDEKVKIGCVYNFGDKLYYSYTLTDNGVDTYGLALVDNSSGTAVDAKFESLWFDGGNPNLEKEGLRVKIKFDKLDIATTIQPKWRSDENDWVYGDKVAINNHDNVIMEINKRFHEIQYGFELTSANDLITPVIKAVSCEIRSLSEERKL